MNQVLYEPYNERAEYNLLITQKQYDNWIKNISKNKTGTSWVYVNSKRKKLFYEKPDSFRKGSLYFEENDTPIMFKGLVFPQIVNLVVEKNEN